MSNKIIELEPSHEGKKRKNFTIIDNPLLDDPQQFDLSDGAFKLLVLLIRYDGLQKLFLSAETLGEKLSAKPKKPRTVFGLLRELETEGYIIRKQRRSKGDDGLVRQHASLISLEPYWAKVNKAQEVLAEKPTPALKPSESAKIRSPNCVRKFAH